MDGLPFAAATRSDDCIEKALVFYAAALKAFTAYYDDPISDSSSAPGAEPFNV